MPAAAKACAEFIVFVLVGAAVSLPAGAEDLLAIFTKARAQDPVFAAAQAQYQAEQERVPQARAGLLPFINLSAVHDHNDLDTRIRGATALQPGSRSFRSYGYTVSLTQPLYRKQNWVVLEQAEVQVRQAETVLALSAQNLVLRVAQAYFDVLAAQDTLAFIGAQKAAIAEQLALAKRNFEVGAATITDTHEAQARFDLATAQEIVALNDLDIRKRVLQQLTGEPPPGLAPLTVDVALAAPEPNDLSQWVNAAVLNNLEVEIQQALLAIAGKEIELGRAGHLPTIDVIASYNDDHATGSTFGAGSDITSRIIGLQFNLPIYQGGLVRSQVRESVALQDRARFDLENARRNAALATQQAFLGIATGIAQVAALKAAEESNRLSLESTQIGQEVGVRTSVDVLNAQQLLFSTRRDLSLARYNTILNLLRLKLAAGTLDVVDLAEVNQWLAGN